MAVGVWIIHPAEPFLDNEQLRKQFPIPIENDIQTAVHSFVGKSNVPIKVANPYLCRCNRVKEPPITT